MADRLLDLTCFVELVGAAVLKILPVMVIVVRTSKARTLGDHDLVVLQQPRFAVRTVHPQFAQGVAVCHPRVLGWLAAPGILFGRDTDPHLTKGRRGMALATAPTNQGLAEAIYRLNLVVTGTLPAKHYGAGAGERSSKDRHSHEAWDLAAADQVGLEVRLLARVAIRRVLNRLFDEERRISEPAGLAADDRFAVLADVHGSPVGPHRPHDGDGQGRTGGLEEPAGMRVY